MRTLLVVATLASLVACNKSDDGPVDSGEPVDVAGPDGPTSMELTCGPDDGPVLQLTVGLAEGSCGAVYGSNGWIEIDLYNRSSALDPGQYDFDGSTGYAIYDAESNEDVVRGRSGFIRINTWTGEAVSGSYEVLTDDNQRVRGAFEAIWCPTQPPCG